jgi:hypothetical protein
MSVYVLPRENPAINFQVINPFSREFRTLINGVTIMVIVGLLSVRRH